MWARRHIGQRQVAVTQAGTMKGPKIEAFRFARRIGFSIDAAQRRGRGRTNSRLADRR